MSSLTPAKALVEDLKTTGGKNAREKSAEVKATVKPQKPKQEKKASIEPEPMPTLEEQEEKTGVFQASETNELELNEEEQEQKPSIGFDVNDMAKKMVNDRLNYLKKRNDELVKQRDQINHEIKSNADEIDNINQRIKEGNF